MLRLSNMERLILRPTRFDLPSKFDDTWLADAWIDAAVGYSCADRQTPKFGPMVMQVQRYSEGMAIRSTFIIQGKRTM